MDKSASKIQSLFTSIASKYDGANDILSLGVHRYWKATLVSWIEDRHPSSLWDCATGTGDVAIRVAQQLPKCHLVGSDFTEQMLAVAKRRAPHLSWELADVTSLPLEDASIDGVAIAFGFRNVQDPVKAACEFARVLKPGGHCWILEFGRPANSLWGYLFRKYSRYVLPVIGGLVSGNSQAYRYLEESSADFPSGAALIEFVTRSSADRLKLTRWKPFLGGMAYLYEFSK